MLPGDDFFSLRVDAWDVRGDDWWIAFFSRFVSGSSKQLHFLESTANKGMLVVHPGRELGLGKWHSRILAEL